MALRVDCNVLRGNRKLPEKSKQPLKTYQRLFKSVSQGWKAQGALVSQQTEPIHCYFDVNMLVSRMKGV